MDDDGFSTHTARYIYLYEKCSSAFYFAALLATETHNRQKSKSSYFVVSTVYYIYCMIIIIITVYAERERPTKRYDRERVLNENETIAAFERCDERSLGLGFRCVFDLCYFSSVFYSSSSSVALCFFRTQFFPICSVLVLSMRMETFIYVYVRVYMCVFILVVALSSSRYPRYEAFCIMHTEREPYSEHRRYRETRASSNVS